MPKVSPSLPIPPEFLIVLLIMCPCPFFFLYQIIPPVEKDPAGFPIYVFVIIAVVLGAMLLIIVLVRRKKRQRKYDLQRESLITASAHAQ